MSFSYADQFIDRAVQKGKPATYCYFSGYAGDGRKYSGSGELGIHATGAISDQNGADDWSWDAYAGGMYSS